MLARPGGWSRPGNLSGVEAAGAVDEGQAGLGEAAFLTARCELGFSPSKRASPIWRRALKLGYPIGPIERERGIALSRLGRHAEAEAILLGQFLKATAPDPEVMRHWPGPTWRRSSWRPRPG